MEWKTVRIFISSTFNDMHAERDYLVKQVFPELREWCEARKLRLIDIDLRWGVTASDSMAKNTVMACLNNIDESRPFFLCLLGQRRGWVPDITDISSQTTKSYPDLKKFVGDSSVTEMEIEHALLSPMLRIVDGKPENPLPAGHALFFFRNDPFAGGVLNEAQEKIYTDKAAANPESAASKLKSFKERIREKYGDRLSYYDCSWDNELLSPELLSEGRSAAAGRLKAFHIKGVPLKTVILEKLREEIRKEFPDHTVRDKQSKEEVDHEHQELFLSLNSEGYIENITAVERLERYVISDQRSICVVYGDAGLGKTMLLANYITRLKARDRKVIYRFCNTSELTSDQYSLWSGIFDEGGVSCPPDFEYIRHHLSQLFSKLSGIVIIDGINQLANGADILNWLPAELPQGLKIILSLKKEEGIDRFLQEAGDSFFLIRLQAMTSDQEKVALIDAYLEKYMKHFDTQQIEALCHASNSDNPLFLKILLSELRVFGAYRQLTEEIKRYGNDTVTAFDAVLDSLEKEAKVIEPSNLTIVPLLFGLLACSRTGLTERELLLSFTDKYPTASEDKLKEDIRHFLRRVRPFTARINGRTDYFYESFKIAAKARYALSLREFQGLLASCFHRLSDRDDNGMYTCDDPRALTELMYHRKQYDKEGAAELLCNVAYLNSRCSCCDIGLLISEYEDVPEVKAKAFRKLLMKNAEVLGKYPNSFFSSALACSEQTVQSEAQAGCVKWVKPYLLQKELVQFNDRKKQDGPPLQLEVSIPLDKTVAVCQPKNADFALYSEGSGIIRLIYTDTYITDDKPILTSGSRPLDIFASEDGKLVAVTHENETADLIRLVFEGGKYAYSKNILQLRFYLPMYSDAVFAFSENILYYQADDGSLKSLEASDPESEQVCVPLPPGAEISMLLPRRDDVLCSYQRNGESVLCILKDNNLTECLTFPKLAVTAACALESGGAAVAFSNSQVCIFEEDMSIKAQIPTPCVSTLLLNSKEGILGIGEFSGDIFLLSQKTYELISGAFWELQYRSKLSGSYIKGMFALISDQRVIRIVPSGGERLQRNIDELPVSVDQAETGYYLFDRGGMLRHYPEEAAMPDLSKYMLSSVRLKSFGDILLLTGISTNAKAVNENKHYLLLVFQIRTDFTLTLILQRYFETDRGMFIDCCYNSHLLYVLFSTPQGNGLTSLPVISYGTLEDFAHGAENNTELAVTKKDISAAAADDTLYICADGLITGYDAASLEYKAALRNESGFRLLLRENDRITAVGNNGSLYQIEMIH